MRGGPRSFPRHNIARPISHALPFSWKSQIEGHYRTDSVRTRRGSTSTSLKSFNDRSIRRVLCRMINFRGPLFLILTVHLPRDLPWHLKSLRFLRGCASKYQCPLTDLGGYTKPPLCKKNNQTYIHDTLVVDDVKLESCNLKFCPLYLISGYVEGLLVD